MNWQRPKSRLTPSLIMAVSLCAVLGGYVAGYFYCGVLHTNAQGQTSRFFKYGLLCRAYVPMGKLEATARGVEVGLCWPAPDKPYSCWRRFSP